METKVINRIKGAFKRRMQTDCGGINTNMYKAIDLDNIKVTEDDGFYRCLATTSDGCEWSAIYGVGNNGKIYLLCGLTYRHRWFEEMEIPE